MASEGTAFDYDDRCIRCTDELSGYHSLPHVYREEPQPKFRFIVVDPDVYKQLKDVVEFNGAEIVHALIDSFGEAS